MEPCNWDLSVYELYREEYSTSEGIITSQETLCMNLERNIASHRGWSCTISHLRTIWSLCMNWDEHCTLDEMILYNFTSHISGPSHISGLSHMTSHTLHAYLQCFNASHFFSVSFTSWYTDQHLRFISHPNNMRQDFHLSHIWIFLYKAVMVLFTDIYLLYL